jgi:hypothetical protein
MSDPAAGSRRSKPSFARRLYKLLTGRGAKIVTALTVVVGIATQVDKLIDLIIKPQEKEKQAVVESPSMCFKARVDAHPNALLVKNWETVQFHMGGANGCKQPLTVHVTYTSNSSSLRIEPPYRDTPQCRSYDVSECWESLSLDGGKPIDWSLAPPKLTQLGHLDKPAKVLINWIVYNTDSKTRLRAGRTEVTVSEGI